MKFVKLTASNFLSFKSLEYDFIDKPILVQGENLTNDGQASNGSGKSSIQAAIDFVISKYTLKPTEIELITWGEESGWVALDIYCPIRKEMLTIKRTIKLKGASQLSLNVVRNGDADPVSFATVADGNKMIMDWIGISKEDLQNYYIVSKERFKSIFVSSNKEKVDVINRFSNAKMIDGMDKIVQVDVDTLESDLKNLLTAKTSSISKIRTLNEQISFELNRDLEQELEEALKFKHQEIEELNELIALKKTSIIETKAKEPEYRTKIKEWRGIIKDKTQILDEFTKSLDKLNEEPDNDKYVHIDTEYSKAKEAQDAVKVSKKKSNNQIVDLEDILDEIEKNIKGSVKCPKCSHEFLIGHDDVDIEEEKQSKIDTERLIEKSKATYDGLIKQIDEWEVKLSDLSDQKDELKKESDRIFEEKQSLKKKINGINAEIEAGESGIKTLDKSIIRISEKVEDLNKDITTIEKDIKQIEIDIENSKAKEIDHKRIAEIRNQMKAEGSKLRDLNYSVRQKKIKIFDTTQWIYNFKKFNMHLANQSLKVIQGYCNQFLHSIDSDIQIRWEGMKILGDGSLREEITAYVLRDGLQKNYWSFSGGERVRMDYSMILTMQKMINATHKYGGLDILMLDEVGEGIDSLGLTDLMKSLGNLQKAILVTTHVTGRTISDNVLLVRKVNGVSTIVKN